MVRSKGGTLVKVSEHVNSDVVLCCEMKRWQCELFPVAAAVCSERGCCRCIQSGERTPDLIHTARDVACAGMLCGARWFVGSSDVRVLRWTL